MTSAARLLACVAAVPLALAATPQARTSLETQTKKPPLQAKKPAPPPAKRTAQRVPFAPGETLTYDISWSSYVRAASATLKVVERKPSYGSEAYYVVAEGQPTPLLSRLYELSYKADTLLDVYSLLPQRGSIFTKEGSRQRVKVTTFDHKARRARYEVQTRTTVKTEVAISPHAQDVLGALYIVRAIPLKPGDTFSIPICDGGESYTVRVSVGAVETVTTGTGSIRAFRLTPVLPPSQRSTARQLTLWLSEDARRLPVRMQAQLAVGTFDLTLRGVGQ